MTAKRVHTTRRRCGNVKFKELSFFVDVSNMRWDLKPEKNGASPAIPLDAYDIDDVARQVDERIKMPYKDFEGKA